MPQSYPGQEWRHGWIPVTPAAAIAKNHGRKPRGGNQSAISRLAAEAGAIHKRMQADAKPELKGTGSDPSKKIDAAIRQAAGRTPEPRHSPPPLTHEQAATMQRGMLQTAPWTGSQREAINEYTAGWAADINQHLRSGSAADPTTKTFTRDLAASMRPLPRGATVYRFVAPDAFGAKSTKAVKSLVGKTMQERGFLSTSLARDGHTDPAGQMRLAARRPVLMEINVPAGTRAAYVDDVSAHKGQWELILDAGTKYRILDVAEDGKQTRVRVEVVL